MSCIHCDHCRQAERNQQENANLYAPGTHLTNPIHGHVIYWRADLQLDGTPGTGHYVYRPGHPDDLFYVYGNDFTVRTNEIDLSGALAAWYDAANISINSDARAELRYAWNNTRRVVRRGRSATVRITASYIALEELRRLAFWLRDAAEATRAERDGARKAIKRLNTILA